MKTDTKDDLPQEGNNLPAVGSTKAVAPLSPLQLYLKEVARYPLLKPEEELELAQKHFEEEDIHAAHRLITANLRLVVKIANDFKKAQVNFLDLIQEGNYGLMQAVKRFNPYKGVKLSSYSAWWIRAYILKYLLDNRGQVKIATTAAQRKLYYNLRKETERLLEEYDHVDSRLIAESLDVQEKDVIEMQKRLTGPGDVSLDAPIQASEESGSRMTHGDLLEDEQAQTAESLLAEQQVQEIFKDHLEEFAATLKGRDLEIFQARILAENPKTLRELGEKYGITRERARQVEARIIKNLKEYVSQKGLLTNS